MRAAFRSWWAQKKANIKFGINTQKKPSQLVCGGFLVLLQWFFGVERCRRRLTARRRRVRLDFAWTCMGMVQASYRACLGLVWWVLTLPPGASNLLPKHKAKSWQNSSQIHFTNAGQNFITEAVTPFFSSITGQKTPKGIA